MIVPGSANPLLMAQAGDPLDELGKIERSVRFRPAAAARFERTPAANGNQKKWTLHVPVKRSFIQGSGSLPPNAFIFGGGSGVTNYSYCGFANNFAGVAASDTLEMNFVVGNGNVGRLTTSRKFRDPAAHYIMTFVVDTAQATASERLRIYIDGARETVFSISGWPTQNADMPWLNSNTLQSLGALAAYAGYYFDGYLSQVCFVDGQALDPAAFGQIHPRTGQWRPKTKAAIRAAVAAGGGARNGWGANGFLLPFDDTTSLTTLGYDRSQSDTDTTGNNWTAVNISLTAGATYDSMADTPTNNHCIINPLPPYLNSGMYFVDSGLGVSGYADATASNLIGTHELTEKIYFEVTASANNGYGQSSIGVANASKSISVVKWLGVGGDYSAYGTYGLAFDRASGKIWIKTPAGAWAGGGDPVTGTSPTATIALGADPAFPVVGIGRSSGSASVGSSYLNAGQRPFVHTPPAEFKAICTKNLKYDSATTVAVSGSFSGNVSANGPTVFMNGCPETLTINGNPVTFGTHADRLANGFKLRTSSASYNASGTNTWTATILSPSIKSLFRFQNAKGN